MKVYQLIISNTNEVIMLGDSKRACQIYAVKFEYAKAVKFKIESTLKICQKTNIIKNFYRLGLDKHYSIKELPQPKVYTVPDAYKLSWLNFYEKI